MTEPNRTIKYQRTAKIVTRRNQGDAEEIVDPEQLRRIMPDIEASLLRQMRADQERALFGVPITDVDVIDILARPAPPKLPEPTE